MISEWLFLPESVQPMNSEEIFIVNNPNLFTMVFYFQDFG